MCLKSVKTIIASDSVELCFRLFYVSIHFSWIKLAVSVILFSGVQTPNCIRQTVFDAVELDYPNVTVITDATAAATPEIHTGKKNHILLLVLVFMV